MARTSLTKCSECFKILGLQLLPFQEITPSTQIRVKNKIFNYFYEIRDMRYIIQIGSDHT